MVTTIFVYGTLKSGEPNHHLLSWKKKSLCRWVGKARTVEKYPLVIATSYNFPCMLYKPGTGKNIEGELYEVDDEQLELVDDLEKHPNWYERTDIIRVVVTSELTDPITKSDREVTPAAINLPTRREITVQAYFLVKYQPSLLKKQMYQSYSSRLEGKTFSMPQNDVTGDNSWWEEMHSEPEKLMDLMNFGEHLKD